MGIVNRRNAIVGWIVIRNRKRVLKEMARTVPPPGSRFAAIVAGAVAGVVGIAGALLFWRKQRGSEAG
jgi:hypothetical protein